MDDKVIFYIRDMFEVWVRGGHIYPRYLSSSCALK